MVCQLFQDSHPINIITSSTIIFKLIFMEKLEKQFTTPHLQYEGNNFRGSKKLLIHLYKRTAIDNLQTQYLMPTYHFYLL